jgi:hypothetical protein
VKRGNVTTSQTRGLREAEWEVTACVRRGYTATSQTRGSRGDGMERGMKRNNSAMRGRVVGRWEGGA